MFVIYGQRRIRACAQASPISLRNDMPMIGRRAAWQGGRGAERVTAKWDAER
jgi:hypothetical protein